MEDVFGHNILMPNYINGFKKYKLSNYYFKKKERNEHKLNATIEQRYKRVYLKW